MLPDTTTDFDTVAVTVAFVDLAGYSVLTEACGDREAAALAARLAELAHSALGPGVRVVKTIGDAVMLAADTPAQMMATITDLADAVATEDSFLPVRTGIHHGAAIARGGDFFGHAVNIAARITTLAGAGQAVITDQIIDAAGEFGLPTIPMGARSLRNITTPIPLHTITLAVTRYPRDPVCGMRIDPVTAPAHHCLQGRDWWFCSTGCAHRFATTPSISTLPPVVPASERPGS